MHTGRRCAYRLSIREVGDKTEKENAENGGNASPPPEEGEEAPERVRELEYEIVCEHATKDEAPIREKSAAHAVRELYTRLYAAQPGAAVRNAAYPYEPGFFFGWLHEPVQTRLHGDPNKESAKLVLPTNASGSARTEQMKRLAAETAFGGMSQAMDAPADETKASGKRNRAEEEAPVLRRSDAALLGSVAAGALGLRNSQPCNSRRRKWVL